MRSTLDLSTIENASSHEFNNTQLNFTEFNIKRKGARPIRFSGIELAMSMSFASEIPYWYEINLYKTHDQQYVSAIRLFHQSSDLSDTITAQEHSNVESALECITQYDAAQDVQLPFDYDCSLKNPASLAASALNLRSRICECRIHYQALVGEFLFDYEMSSA